MTDIHLHFRHMGDRTLYQLYRMGGDALLSNDAFQTFLDDMEHWVTWIIY